jgi:uncharacterized coiled-coil DUF342 family protein
LLVLSKQLSNDTVYATSVSYKELGKFLDKKSFHTENIQTMEQRYSSLSQASVELRSKVNQTNSEANQLFSLLQTRANQNSTPELKSKMISDINDKQKVFNEKMQIANEVVSKIEASVKKYDDILGYVQVATGLDQIDQYINDVDKVIVQASALNSEIQNALSANQTIVASFKASQ